MRGSKRLYVSSTASFSMNSWMRLLMDNLNNALLADLNGLLTPPDAGQNNKADIVQFNFLVTEVRVQLQRVWSTTAYLSFASDQCSFLPPAYWSL